MTVSRVLPVCLLLLLPLVAVAQDADSGTSTSFSSLRFGVSGGMVFRDRGMTDWDPGPAARMTVDTPYGIGKLRADVSWQAWSGGPDRVVIDANGVRSSGSLPDVQTLAVVAGWGWGWGWDSDPTRAVSVEAGCMLGNLFMLFDLPSGTAARFESEILTGPWIRVNRRLGIVQVYAEIRAHRVLTRPRWDVLSPGVGMALEMAIPAWMKWVLQ